MKTSPVREECELRTSSSALTVSLLLFGRVGSSSVATCTCERLPLLAPWAEIAKPEQPA